jgi:hypothetical protein
MQSIFSLRRGARLQRVSRNGRRRDGGLKMDWTRPLHDWSAYGY